MIERLWITGYRSFELGIFGKDDPKEKIIEQFLKQKIEQYISNGLQWVITGAQLGIEQYSINATWKLKKENFEIKHAVMLPFSDFGKNWNESNSFLFQQSLKKADYYNYVSSKNYINPSQLKNWQDFMLNHTDGLLIIYEPENEEKGKPEFDYIKAIEYSQNHNYPIEIVHFDDLDDYLRSISEE
ncbi:SLOG family protein [Companilactobacillus sp. DQM5]|uniref:SLOG family protein n=1 Tax=Companilactobacillus sp. DQM5 TaxID=3463359 RepID=UPI0040591F98